LVLITLSAQPVEAPATTALPVSFISTTDFTQLTQGVKNGTKSADAKPLADKIDTAKSVEQLAPKVADKPEVTTEANKSKPETKPDAKQADKPDKAKTPEYKPDQIASLLKKDEIKKPDNQQQKPAQEQPKFDADQVAALLD
jgi:hypothetical protein